MESLYSPQSLNYNVTTRPNNTFIQFPHRTLVFPSWHPYFPQNTLGNTDLPDLIFTLCSILGFPLDEPIFKTLVPWRSPLHQISLDKGKCTGSEMHWGI